ARREWLRAALPAYVSRLQQPGGTSRATIRQPQSDSGLTTAMKITPAGVAGVALFVSSAFAADLRTPVFKAAPPPPDPWSAVYGGLNLGYSFGAWSASSNQRVFDFEAFNASPRLNGVLGGAQLGFNQRVSRLWVWGIEADIQATGERARQRWADPEL